MASVVGAFDPGDDRPARLVAGSPAMPVDDLALEGRQDRSQDSDVGGGSGLAHGPDHVVADHGALEFP